MAAPRSLDDVRALALRMRRASRARQGDHILLTGAEMLEALACELAVLRTPVEEG